MEMKFYVCSHCGNIIAYAKNSGVPVVCCGERMQELVPNTTDAAQEKHVPVCTQEGNLVTVEVGSTAHPMLEEHYIEWIGLQTAQGNQRKALNPGDAPKAVFAITEGDTVEAVLQPARPLEGITEKISKEKALPDGYIKYSSGIYLKK